MAVLKRILRLVGLVALLSLSLVVGAVLVLTLTQRGRDNLAGLVSEMASTADARVRIGGLGGLWSGHLTADHLVLEDAKGPWLVARGVEIDWSPLALLLGSTFDAERVAAARVEVARLPESGEGAQGGGDALPVSLAVDRLVLPDIALGEAIAGGVARLAAEGSLVVDKAPLAIDADLALRRTDGTEGALSAELRYVPDDAVLDVAVKGSEAEGGILANLLGLPGAPPVAVEIAGSGSAADWKGQGTLSVDGTVRTTVAGEVAAVGDRRRLALTGEGTFDRFLPAGLRPLAAGNLSFDVEALAGGLDDIAVERATLRSASARATAAGTLDRGGASDFSFDIAATGAPVPLTLELGGQSVALGLSSATARAFGDGSAPMIDLSAALASLSVDGQTLRDVALSLHSDGFDLAAGTGPVTVEAEAKAVASASDLLRPLLDGPATLSLAGSLGAATVAIESAELAVAGGRASLSGTVSRATPALSLELDAHLAAQALPPAAQGALGERLQLGGRLSRGDDGGWSLEGLGLRSGPLTAEGSATLSGGALKASLAGRHDAVGRLSPQLAGAVAFSADLEGPPLAPNAALRLTADRLTASGRELTDVALTASGPLDPARPDAALSLAAKLDGQALSGSGRLRAQDGTARLDDLVLALGDNRVTGAVAIGPGGSPAGTLQFALPDVAPLAALAGEVVEGSASGTATLDVADGRPRLQIAAAAPSLRRGEIVAHDVRLDATVADYLRAPAPSGRLRAEGIEAGGATVAGADLALAPRDGWIGFDGSAAVNGVPVAASGRVQGSGGATTVELTALEARYRDVAARLAAPASIRIADGTAVFENLTLSAAGGSVTLSGRAGETLSLEAAVADLPVALAGALLPRLEASGRASGRVVVSGAAAAPQVELRLTADGEPVALAFPLGTDRLEAALSGVNGTARLAGDTLSLDVSAGFDRLAGAGATLREARLRLRSGGLALPALTGPLAVEIAADGAASGIAALDPLVAGPISATLAGTLTPEALRIDEGTLATGAATARIAGTVGRAGPEMALTLEADAAAAALPAGLRPALGERVALSAAVGRDAGGGLVLDDLEVDSGPLTAAGRAAIADGALDAALTGRFQEVSRLAGQAAGAVEFSATAKGPLQAPEATLTVRGDRIVAAGRTVTDLALTARGTVDVDNPAAELTLAGAVDGEALSGTATLTSSGGRHTLRDLALSLGDNRIAGALALDAGFVPEGTVTLDVPELGPLAALAGQSASGALDGTVTFRRSGGVPEVAIDARIPTLTMDGIGAREVTATATVRDYAGSPTVTGKIAAAAVTRGGVRLSDVAVDLSRDGDWTGFDGTATINGVPAAAAGRVRVAGGDVTVELGSGRATLQGVTATLARPATIEVAGGQAALDDLTLTVAGGSVVLSGTAGETLALEARIAGLPASALNTFSAGLGASGTISGRARVSGPATDPSVGFSIDWSDARTAQTTGAGFAALSLAANGTYQDGRVTFTSTIGGGGGLGLKGGGTVTTAGGPALDLDYSGTVPFAFLTQRLAAQGLSLSGAATVAITARGAALAPQVSGTVTTAGARLVHAPSGIAIDDLSAEIALASGTATVRSASGTLSTGGRVTGSGTVGIDAAAGFPADLSLRLADARYTDGRVVTTTLGGDIALKGPLAGQPTLSGRIDLGRTVITVPERLPASIATLDVQHRNAPRAVTEQKEALRPPSAGGAGGGLLLDVTVSAPQQIFVRGRGLEAELGGSLRLTGSTAAPQAVGEFTLRRGRLSLLARRLEFTRGTIGFSGSPVPTLDLAADTAVSDATVTVSVTGPATDPQFTFSSSPSLPQDEVLARLVFGRSLSNLSPLQIAQLADAAAQIAGVGGPSSLLEGLRNATGIDDLEVKTDAEGNAAVSAGKYLNDRTYVTIEKGEKAGSGKATINLDVGRGLKLRGEAGESGEAKGGIFFEREY